MSENHSPPRAQNMGRRVHVSLYKTLPYFGILLQGWIPIVAHIVDTFLLSELYEWKKSYEER